MSPRFLKNVQLQLPLKTDAWIFGRGRGDARLQRADFTFSEMWSKPKKVKRWTSLFSEGIIHKLCQLILLLDIDLNVAQYGSSDIDSFPYTFWPRLSLSQQLFSAG